MLAFCFPSLILYGLVHSAAGSRPLGSFPLGELVPWILKELPGWVSEGNVNFTEAFNSTAPFRDAGALLFLST